MNDKYHNFNELKKYEVEGEDYIIESKMNNSDVLIMAPHGGKIEPHTSEIAKEIAGDIFSYYSFMGIKEKNNFNTLHIQSTNFDESKGLEIVKKSELNVTIHGHGKDKLSDYILIGGRNNKLKTIIGKKLGEIFNVKKDYNGLEGESEENICNRCLSGKGVQLEFGKKIRHELISNKNYLRNLSKKMQIIFKKYDESNINQYGTN
ncbi:MAG: poly-gamma-glutamate hydrolase family protein [Atribacterota bacterium]